MSFAYLPSIGPQIVKGKLLAWSQLGCKRNVTLERSALTPFLMAIIILVLQTTRVHRTLVSALPLSMNWCRLAVPAKTAHGSPGQLGRRTAQRPWLPIKARTQERFRRTQSFLTGRTCRPVTPVIASMSPLQNWQAISRKVPRFRAPLQAPLQAQPRLRPVRRLPVPSLMAMAVMAAIMSPLQQVLQFRPLPRRVEGEARVRRTSALLLAVSLEA